MKQCFSVPTVLPNQVLVRAKPYQPGFMLHPSPLRLHCPVQDWLLWWQPLFSCATRTELADSSLDRILRVMVAAWAPGTRLTDSTGLLIFHVYCDSNNIPESHRYPTDTTLLLSFIATCLGSYFGTALANKIHGLRTWHILHGVAWAPSSGELTTILMGVTHLATTSL